MYIKSVFVRKNLQTFVYERKHKIHIDNIIKYIPNRIIDYIYVNLLFRYL